MYNYDSFILFQPFLRFYLQHGVYRGAAVCFDWFQPFLRFYLMVPRNCCVLKKFVFQPFLRFYYYVLREIDERWEVYMFQPFLRFYLRCGGAWREAVSS